LNYLRISVTDRCNLRCTYCVPEGVVPKLRHANILRYEELLRLTRIAETLGISKVRITGGEPLVRKGLIPFLEKLCAIDGLTDVSLTTNGVLLGKHIRDIYNAGIRRINISLDTLDREKFQKITGYDGFKQVWHAIESALELGFSPIKINAVALQGINDNELTELAKLTFRYPFHVRFIEFMPIGRRQADVENLLLTPQIKARISTLGNMIPMKKGHLDGPAETFQLEGAKGRVGFISALSRHFCHQCNRLRITASGQLRPCLLSDYQEDLKGPMRNGALDEELREIFMTVARRKHAEHHIEGNTRGGIKSQMSSIGG